MSIWYSSGMPNNDQANNIQLVPQYIITSW